MNQPFLKALGRTVLQPFPSLATRLYALATAPDTLQTQSTSLSLVQDSSLLVHSFYKIAFGRWADPQDLAHCIHQLKSGVSPERLAEELVGSAEFRARHGSSERVDTDYVTALYRDGLGRLPDPEGPGNWLAEGEKRATRGKVLAGLAGSDEALRVVATLLVSSLYQTALGRPADEDGLLNCLRQLLSGLPLQALAETLVASAEFQTRHGSSPIVETEYLTALYRDGLGRLPDPEGLANWLAEGEKGATRPAVLAAFARSSEALHRVVASADRPKIDNTARGPATSSMGYAGGLMDRFFIACRAAAVDVHAYGEAVCESFLSPIDAFAHYQAAGKSAYPELFPFVDPDYYTTQLGQQIPEAVTPFEHYVTYGAKRDLSPNPIFDPGYVRLQGGDNRLGDIFDFLSDPDCASVDPHILFSKQYYRSVHPDVKASNLDPFWHFVWQGWKERRAIHPFFGAREFLRFEFPPNCSRLEFNKHLASALESPALASTQALFDTLHYLESLSSNEDIANPLQHFLTTGWRQGASPFPLFDQAFFLSQTPRIPGARNPYVEYLSDFSHACGPNKFFDPTFYLQSAPEASSFGGSLLEHFVRFGCAGGARPHRLVTIANACPSRHSGFAAINSFVDASERMLWLCTPADDGSLASSIDGMREIEPGLPREFLDVCSLHPACSPLTKRERALISVTTKCARCNCLVVSEQALDDELVMRLLSPQVGLTSTARPWLTLISSSTLRYWHVFNGCIHISDLPLSSCDGLLFVAELVVASIPNKLVVRMDPFGVALFRGFGSKISAAVREISLLLDSERLDATAERWLIEYVETNYPRFRSLICGTRYFFDFAKSLEVSSVPNVPSVFWLGDLYHERHRTRELLLP
jgi:hypothetical protein